MSTAGRARRLRAMLAQVSRDEQGGAGGLESLRVGSADFGDRGGLESMPGGLEGVVKATNANLEALWAERPISDAGLEGLEAIIMVKKRPVALVKDSRYADLGAPWTHLNAPAVRSRLEPLIPSIGRIELPGSELPYGGTGFVVGKNLIMTNRHVAQEFVDGLGVRGLRYRTGGAAVDFAQEQPLESTVTMLAVRDVIMVHPYWDMALLVVDGLPANRAPLRLSVKPPEAYVDRETVVIGYPAEDSSRNDAAVQQRVFQGVFRVKRFQPGRVRVRTEVKSFENMVQAMTHDASTLGGNSGSAVIDVATGEVVGLHFGGVYMRANFAVPMYELARDPYVVARGLNFTASVPAGGAAASAWVRVEGGESPPPPPPPPPGPTMQSGTSMTWTIPIHVTISVGGASPQQPSPAPPPPAAPPPVTEAMRVPIIHDGLTERTGYRPNFLDDGGAGVPLPTITPAGLEVLAKLEDGSWELKYHRFSVAVHKRRRLALFTASNVDWRSSQRTVNGKKPTRRLLTGLREGDIEKWVTDPRIPDNVQLPDIFYTKDGGAFDKGHLVRRDDVAWGATFEEIQRGNGDTYHTPNCSPQIAKFNQGGKGDGDNWGDLEKLVEIQKERAIVFSGPVLAADDRFFHGRDDRGNVSIQVPTRFWKIIVTGPADNRKAYGFLLEQDLSGVSTHDELIVPPEWEHKRVPIAEIEGLLFGLAALEALRPFDQAIV